MQEGFALHEIICDQAGRPVDYRFLDVNPAFEALTGLARERVVGRTVLEVLPGTERHWIDVYGRVALTGEPARLTNYARALDRYFEVVAFCPAHGQFAAIFTDVTERRRAEQALAESEERLTTIFRELSVVIMVTALSDGRILEVNEAFTRFSGYTRAEALGRTTLELGLITPEDRARVYDQLREKGAVSGIELSYRSRSGRVIVGLVSGSVITISGEPCLLALISDITELRRTEAALRRYQLLANHASDAMLFVRPGDGRLLDANTAALRLYGYELEEMRSLTVFDLRAPETRRAATGQLAQAASQDLLFETMHRRKDGRTFPVEVSSHGAEVDGEPVLLKIIRDITARKQEERQQAAIVAVSAALRTAVARAEMLPAILDQTRTLLDVEDVALVSVEPETGETLVEAARGAWEAMAGQRLPAGAGTSWRMIAAGQPVVSQAVPQDPQPRRLALAEGMVAAAIAPLIAQGQAIGALAVGSEQAIEPAQWRLLEVIADIAANALQRASLYEQARRRADEFATLHAVARELAAQQDLPWLLETIVTRSLDLIPASGALIALTNLAGDALTIEMVRGLPIQPGVRVRPGEGMIGRVAQTWQPLRLEDYHTWEGRSPRFEDIPFSAVLGAPMLSGGSLVGVLGLADVGPTGRRFSQADADLLTLLASHAASAVHNAQALDEARWRADQLALLYDAALALNSVLEPRLQLEYLAKVTGQALSADVIEFFRVDAETGALSLELTLGHSDAARARLRGLTDQLTSERSVVHDVIRTRLPLNVPDLYSDPRYIVIDPELRSGLWVPVQHQGRMQGLLGVLSRRLGAFDEHDERLLLLFANQTAVAIQNARLFAETERRLRRVQALRQVDVTIASSLELRPVLNVLLEQTLAQLQVEAGAILLLDRPRQTLEHAASHGFRTRLIERAHLPLADGLAGQAARERRIAAIPDLARSPAPPGRSELLQGEGFKAYFAAPLIFRGQLKGLLEVFHRAPLNPDQEWLDYLETLAGQAALAVENVGLFDDLQRSNAELTQAYDATIEGWSRALDLRDRETEGHSRRVTDMTLALAEAMGLSAEALVHIRRGALLHDIGKMGVPDAILLKPGPLSDEEWASMRRHPELAYAMLSPIEFLRPALDIPYCHHEKWDGTGYPRGLTGEQIPLAARLFAVVDVWDALRSDRPYRPAWSREAARAHIRQQAGAHFDPAVVPVFLDLEERWAAA